MTLASAPRLLVSLAALASALAAAGGAQAQSGRASSDGHDGLPADILVTAPIARELAETLAGTSILTGDSLARELRPTIGDTLARQPGVSASSFGPNASRPILRGLQGDRVRVLTDGIGSFDVSTSSDDHEVVINPLTAERIEILRGPAALLFGSAAIGGVVNVLDGRIPRRLPDEPVHAETIATYGSAGNERAAAARLDAPLGLGLVGHVDASLMRADDLRSGRGEIENSAARRDTYGAGLSWIGETANLGASVSRHDSRYGIPNRHEDEVELQEEDHEEGHHHHDVRIDARQTRYDLRGSISPGGAIEEIRLRAGVADYRHDELEPSGEVGSSFFSDGAEARLELTQATQGNWRGAFGAQFFTRDVHIEGEEKYLPRNRHSQYGLFTLQETRIGALTAEIGARYEHSVARADADADLATPALRRSFDAFSTSLGGSLAIGDGWRTGLNLSRSTRAPTPEELFANGPHAGTQSWELGDASLKREESWGVEATLRGKGPGYRIAAAAYHNWFSNYIYQADAESSLCEAAAGDRDTEGLPCLRRAQADARYWGFEIEGEAELARIGSFALSADAMLDHVRARILGNGPAPRIPPLRLIGGLAAASDRLDGRIEIEHAAAQKRVALLETATPAYTLVNASLSWRPFASEPHSSLSLSANNLFDVVALRHSSLLKEEAPLAGRDIRLTLRLAL